MPDISIQFHMSPDELLIFIKENCERNDLFGVAAAYSPFSVFLIDSGNINEVLKPSVRRIIWTLDKPYLQAKDQIDFSVHNQDELRLEIGRLTEHGLEQSWLTARTENEDTFLTWKKISQSLAKKLKKGVTAINKLTGASVLIASYRYSMGATKLEMSGVNMLPPQGVQGPKLVLGQTNTISE